MFIPCFFHVFLQHFLYTSLFWGPPKSRRSFSAAPRGLERSAAWPKKWPNVMAELCRLKVLEVRPFSVRNICRMSAIWYVEYMGWWFQTWLLYTFMTFHILGIVWNSHPNWLIAIARCSMVLEYLPTELGNCWGKYVSTHSIHGASGIWYNWLAVWNILLNDCWWHLMTELMIIDRW